MGVLAVGDPAPEVTLQQGEGEVRLSELWRQGPLVLVFLRHFG